MTNDNFERRPHSDCFEVVNSMGTRSPMKFDSHEAAAAAAKKWFPDQEQDPDRTGAGWDIQKVGS